MKEWVLGFHGIFPYLGISIKVFFGFQVIGMWFIWFCSFSFQEGGKDIMTGLKSKTNAGRPNWDKIFQKLQDERKGKITVFYCGNPIVGSILRGKCEQYGFDFRKEVF